MTVGVWVLGDQLWSGQSALQGCRPQQTPVLFIESLRHARKRPFHLQKLVLVWSAMRHFAETLRQDGWIVSYSQAEEFETPLLNWIEQHHITELRMMMPTDCPFISLIQSLNLPCILTFTPSNRFIWPRQEVIGWTRSRKRLLMEDFDREGRQRFNVLMDGEHLLGGCWNFDRENRKSPKGKLSLPEALWFEPDPITQRVIDWITASPAFQDSQTYWQIHPFRWGVTHQQALQVLDFFIKTRLSDFGFYQDAMVMGEQTMWHAMFPI